MAEEAECGELMIENIRRNLRQFGSVHPPPQTQVGRRRTVTPPMLEALCERKPGLYLDEMTVFLWDEFQALVTTPSTVSERPLSPKVCLKKTAWQKAREQNGLPVVSPGIC